MAILVLGYQKLGHSMHTEILVRYQLVTEVVSGDPGRWRPKYELYRRVSTSATIYINRNYGLNCLF
jgi:hypothetical protein